MRLRRASARSPGEDDEAGSAPAQVDLSAWNDAFAKASTGALPDGRYHVRVQRVELRSSRFSADPLLRWTLRLVDPHPGRLLTRNHVIRADGLHILKRDLHLCGLELSRLSDLPAHLAELADRELEVTLRTVGDYQRVYFERSLAPLSFP